MHRLNCHYWFWFKVLEWERKREERFCPMTAWLETLRMSITAMTYQWILIPILMDAPVTIDSVAKQVRSYFSHILSIIILYYIILYYIILYYIILYYIDFKEWLRLMFNWLETRRMLINGSIPILLSNPRVTIGSWKKQVRRICIDLLIY